MASVDQTTSPRAREPFREETRYIDAQIRQTSRSLKLVDLVAGAVTLAVGVLAYLLMAAILDHWVVPGGLTVGMRGTLFAFLALGTAWFCWRSFAPLVRPISPIYAAHAIEQGSTSLKNSLLNLLLLRDQSQRISERVFQAIERQAAHRLSQSPTDAVVDRGAVLRAGYVLVAVVCVCALYAVLSPKDVATSAVRVLAPWSSTPAPSRVQILDVSPGDSSVARGERVDVSALVLGAGEDDVVVLRYSSLDGRFTGESANMRAGEDESRYELQLPPPADRTGTIGVQHDLLYWIESGDGRSETYKLTVFERPTIVVQRIRYEFPAYTGMRSVATESSGDIRAVEGTKVTVQALANHPISSAAIDFDANGSSDLRMRIDGDQAVATFELRLRPDRRTPEHASYVLRFATDKGRQNRDPAKYVIDVSPDYAPEVRIVSPAEPEVTVHVDETLPIAVEAHDPDFALSQIELMGQTRDRDMTLGQLLSSNVAERFVGAHPFTPRDVQLQPGDIVEYWAQAADNRQPEPNLALSQRRRLRIVGRSDLADDQQRQNQQGEEGDQGDQQQQSGDGSESDEGGTPGDSGQSGESSDESDSQTGQGGQGDSNESSTDAESSQSDEKGGGQSGQPQENDSQNGSVGDTSQDSQDRDSQNSADAGRRDQQQGDARNSNDSSEQSSNASQPGEQSENGDPGGQESEQQSKVSPDGDDDATAFERIRRRLEQTGDGQEQEQSDASSAEGDGPQQEEPRRDNGQNSGPNQAQNGQDDRGADSRGDDQTPGNEDGQRANAQSDQDDSHTSASDGAPDVDAGAQGRDAEEPSGVNDGQPGGQQEQTQGESNESSANGEPEEGPGSSADPSQGDDGAGLESGRDQDGLGPESPNRQRDKTPESNELGQQPDNPEPPSASDSKSESDSRGGQQGDQSGGGGRGGGQPSAQQGRGASGENDAADEGGGAASERGDGEAGQGAGQDQQSDGQTGQSSGNQPGGGSQSGDVGGNESGDRSTEDSSASDQNGADNNTHSSGDQTGQRPSDRQPSDRQSDSQSPPKEEGDGQPGSSGESQSPSGGGSGNGFSSPSSSELQPGDDPNIEFARQQTDLVLDQLEQQLARDEVEPELLEDLRWNKEELKRFIERWRNLEMRANQPGDAGAQAQRELNEALISTGLRRDGQRDFQVRGAADGLDDLQSGGSSNAPLEYRDSVRAYTRGAAAASSAKDE